MNEQRRSLERSLRSWLATLSLVIALAIPTAIFAGGAAGAADDPLVAETTLFANCTIDDDFTSQNDPEGDNISYTGSDTNGASSAASQSLRTFNHAEFTPPPPSGIFGEDCDMDGGFENQFAVEPGSSGLAPGTLVTLQLTLRLDGRTNGWGTGTEGWYSHTENGASYSLQDSTVQCVPNPEGEGCSEVYSARFSAGVELERQASVANPSYPDGRIDESYGYDWSLDSNRGSHLEDEDFDFTILCPTYPCEPVVCPGLTCDLGVSKEFDTGSQTVLFDTKVGAVISIDAGINTFTQAYGPGPSDSLADFLDTFTSGITPATGFEGLHLRYATDPPVVSMTPAQRIQGLINLIASYDLKKDPTHELEKSLKDLLREKDLRKVCDHLYKFSDKVRKESGKKMTTAQANAVLAEAQSIRDQLGCGPEKKPK